MIAVNFYRFKKKKNSTAQPSDNPTVMQCAIKSDCSVVNPVLEIAPGQGTFVFNYAYIPDFGRFYFVNDWKYSVGTWTVYLSVDVLASYKTAIGNHSAYVLRAASRYNENIIDELYPVLPHPNTYTETMNNCFNVNNATVVIGVVAPGGLRCGLRYYAMTTASAIHFFSWLLGVQYESENSNFLSWLIDTFHYTVDDTVKIIYKPEEYIKSAQWYPFSVMDYMNWNGEPNPTAITRMYFGKYYLPEISGATFYELTKPCLYLGEFFADLTRNTGPNYLTSDRYIKRKLIMPPFSSMDIPEIVNKYAVKVKNPGDDYKIRSAIYVDITSGQAVNNYFLYDVYASSDIFHMGTDVAEMGINIPIVSATKNIVENFFTGVVNLGGAVAGSIIGEASMVGRGVAGTIGSFAGLLGSDMKYNASSSAATAYYKQPWQCITISSQITDRNISEHGAPLCETVTLNTLSGYIQCADSDIEIGGTEQEIDAVNNFLTGGFFYE